MVPLEAGEAAPWWVTFAAGVGGIGSLCAMIVAAFKPKKEDATARVATETVALADDKPLRSSLEHVEAYMRRIAENTDALVGLEKKRIEREEQNQIRAEARIEAQEEYTRSRLNERLARLDREDREPRGGRV